MCVFVCVCVRVCVSVCVRARACVRVCRCVWRVRGLWWGLGGRWVRVHVCVHARAWVCTDDPSDGYCGRRNTKHPAFANASRLRDDVHLEDLMYVIITREPATVLIKGLDVCCCVSDYACDVCLLLLMLFFLSSILFIYILFF